MKIFDCKSGKVVKTIKSVPDEFELSFKKIDGNLYYEVMNSDGSKTLKKSKAGGGNAAVLASIPQNSSTMSITDTDVIYLNSGSYFKYSFRNNQTESIDMNEAFDAFYKSISGNESYNVVR